MIQNTNTKMKDTEQTTIAEFIETHGITMSSARIPARPDQGKQTPEEAKWAREASRYCCTLHRGGHNTGKGPEEARFTTFYSMGSAHRKAPTAEEVLNGLKLDARSAEDTFEDWCLELGYDEDSRSAERTYNACRDIAAKLREFLTPEQFIELMDCESL